MANKMDVTSWIKMIKQHEKEIAEVRDNLDDSISQMTDLKECCEKAYDELQSARDALSELV